LESNITLNIYNEHHFASFSIKFLSENQQAGWQGTMSISQLALAEQR